VGADAARRLVYKMHGSIPEGATEPVGGMDKLVLSTDDFDRYAHVHPRFWRLLQAQFLTRSFLYVGFSLSDPNFMAMVQLARLATADRPMSHYALIRRDEDLGAEFDLWARDLERAGVHLVEIAAHAEVPALLRQLIARTKPCRLFISGSQPTGQAAPADNAPYPSVAELKPGLQAVAETLGRQLAEQGIQVATANLLGATVGYALLNALDEYDPDRLLLIRRTKDEPLDPPNMRRGRLTFVGDSPEGMRVKLYAHTRAILVLAGGAGTRTEVEDSASAGMGVVPLACTGGTAREIWEEMAGDLGAHSLGGRPISPEVFALLDSHDPPTAIDAAIVLVRQAMYLPET